MDVTNADGSIDQVQVADGGFRDRTGLQSWGRWAAVSPETPRKALIHLIDSSQRPLGEKRKVEPLRRRNSGADADTNEEKKSYLSDPQLHTVGNAEYFIVRTPRSRASFFSLKDYEAQKQVAYARAMKAFVSPGFAEFKK